LSSLSLSAAQITDGLGGIYDTHISNKTAINATDSIDVTASDGEMIDISTSQNMYSELQISSENALLTSLNDTKATGVTDVIAVNTTSASSGEYPSSATSLPLSTTCGEHSSYEERSSGELSNGHIIDNRGSKQELQCPNVQDCNGINDIKTYIDTKNVSIDIIHDYQYSINELLKKPYMWWKKIDVDYSIRRTRFLSMSPFNLWLCDDPLINEQFPLEIIECGNQSKGRKKRDSSQLQETQNNKKIKKK
jgi:hypothetical protein